MVFDFSRWETPRRTFEPDANDLDAKACGTAAGHVADFKRRHGLARDERLSDAARASLDLELDTAARVNKGRAIERAQARDAHPDAGGDRHRFERLTAARDRLLLEVAP